ncbi:MAG: lytic murein transglycosylase, partial [Alphaproteobacteria bacterium]|nr:lytic murein transglycosylase [Alphaproteobacteria bacterium]
MKVLSFLLAAVFLLSPQVETQAQTASDAPVVETSIGTLGPFEKWLEGVRQEARGQGISESTLYYALRDIKPIARIIELDRRQPEFTLTLDQYLDRTIPASRVAKARRKFAENRELL